MAVLGDLPMGTYSTNLPNLVRGGSRYHMRRYASVLHSCTCCIFLAFFRRINVFIIEYYSRGTPATLSPSPWYSRNSCPHSQAFSVESAGFPPYRFHCRHLLKSRKDDCLMCSVCLCIILVDLIAKLPGLTTLSSQIYRLLFFLSILSLFWGFFWFSADSDTC